MSSSTNINITGEGSLTSIVITVVVALIVTAVVLVPIISSATTTEINVPGGENENPVGDLRLTYSESQDVFVAMQMQVQEGTLTLALFDDMESGEPSSILTFENLTDNVIIFASDYFTIILQDGLLYQSTVGNVEDGDDYSWVVVSEGLINFNLPYTFIYYPSEEGEYANFQSYEFDAGSDFAIGTAYGMAFASKNGSFVGYSDYDVTVDTVSEGGEVIGVDYQVSAGDGTGTLPDDNGGGGGGGEETVMH